MKPGTRSLLALAALLRYPDRALIPSPPKLRKALLSLLAFAAFLPAAPRAHAIEIVLDFTFDEQNYNLFNPATAEGLARRRAVESAAGFLSTIIRNDDWNPISNLNRSFGFSDLSESSIKNLSGNSVNGSAESDGEGYSYTFTTSNHASLGANQYLIYVGAFFLDSGTGSHAIGGWNGASRRNAAGSALTEFNTWGGRIWFNMDATWYAGSNPGLNPTNNYGTQDPDKSPSSDISSDNWDWSTGSMEWKGFHLSTIDPSISGGASDLYGVTLHELMHALGLTSSGFTGYVGVDSNGDANGANIVAEYGSPVPRSSSGGHFDSGIQSEVWDSDGIISEVTLDPSTTTGRRKYLTKLDAAALRDLGYDVASTWAEVAPDYALTISPVGNFAKLDWSASTSSNSIVDWSTDLIHWTSISVGTANTWTDSTPFGARRFYRITE